jgi:hypothetical protein
MKEFNIYIYIYIRERDRLGEIGTDERVILQETGIAWILEAQDEMVSCEHGNESEECIKDG